MLGGSWIQGVELLKNTAMSVFAVSDPFLILKNSPSTTKLIRFVNPCSSSTSNRTFKASPKLLRSQFQFRHNSWSSCCYKADSNVSSSGGSGGDDDDLEDENDDTYDGDDDDDVFIEIEKLTRNSRRIQSKVAIDASLETVWNILTDYERLADFIPGLAVSQLLEKRPNFARLYQIGEQDLAFGLKFNAKGVVDCYEKDLQTLPSGKKRDIEFNMVEGDFQIFQGKWSIEQCDRGSCKSSDSALSQNSQSTLSYTVNVEPKLWLPVGLVEGRLCKEIKTNLLCIRREAQKANNSTLSTCS